MLERFPKLKIISAENHADWLPVFLKRLGNAFRNRPSSYATKLSMPPVDYFHRQVYVTYMNDVDAIGNRDLIGVDNLAFATDYPHGASTWPNSQKIVERDFASLPEEGPQADDPRQHTAGLRPHGSPGLNPPQRARDPLARHAWDGDEPL